MNHKLTLKQYLKAAFYTGIYPGDGQTDRELTPEEQLEFERSLTVKLHMTNSIIRPEVLAESLFEREGQVIGTFKAENGEIYSGIWSNSVDGFIGTLLSIIDTVLMEIDYVTSSRVYPAEAINTACSGSEEPESHPIFLFQGRPARQVKDRAGKYTNYIWRKLHVRGTGWVERPRSGTKRNDRAT